MQLSPEQRQAILNSRRRERQRLIRRELVRNGITDKSVLDAMDRVPREIFVEESSQHLAYKNCALGIAEGQTISQPYIVALMAQSLALQPDDRLLEIGTGSGYAAAVYAEIVDEVFTIERFESLANSARERLESLHYDRVQVRTADGFEGWPEQAPFDAISVAAATEYVPERLVEQLRIGGRLVIPIGSDNTDQELFCYTRTVDGTTEQSLGRVRFVPLLSGKIPAE